jgi:hypothetical protein
LPDERFRTALQLVLEDYGILVTEELAAKIAALPPAASVLTHEERREARLIFEGTHPSRRPCTDCGGVHARACPRVRSHSTTYEYVGTPPMQNLISYTVTYFKPGQWETDDIIFPAEAYQEDE